MQQGPIQEPEFHVEEGILCLLSGAEVQLRALRGSDPALVGDENIP